MKEQLIRYVDLLFAGSPDAVDIKQEILQNSLDRYDDLIAQGKSPEAAYSLAISGIGDVSELLGNAPSSAPTATQMPVAAEKPLWKRLVRAFGILLYIICPIPLFVLSEIGMATLGLCGTLAVVAVATALMIIAAGGQSKHKQRDTSVPAAQPPQKELCKAVGAILWTVGLIFYFIISFLTRAWYITWVIFPMIGAAQGLLRAIIDLKEAGKHGS